MSFNFIPLYAMCIQKMKNILKRRSRVMDKKIIEKLEEEYIRYIKANSCCEDVDDGFIFAGGTTWEGITYSDYSDYSDR